MSSEPSALIGKEVAKRSTYFVDCCSQPQFKGVELPEPQQTVELDVYLLDFPILVNCANCGQPVTVCPKCNQGFCSIVSLANWQNHYSQFAYYDTSTTIRRAMRLLDGTFTMAPIEQGHRFYTLFQGSCNNHTESYIWLQERPAKVYSK